MTKVYDETQGFRKYFHIMLNMDDDDLDPYEYRLLGHYRRRCGADGGKCNEGMRGIAKHCRMSIGKVSETRAALVEKGYIRVESRGEHESDHVYIVDKMSENVARYSSEPKQVKPVPVHEVNGGVHEVNGGVHEVNGGVHEVNGGVHEVNERRTTKNNQQEEKSTSDKPTGAQPEPETPKPEKPKPVSSPIKEKETTPSQELERAYQKASGMITFAANGSNYEALLAMVEAGVTPEQLAAYITHVRETDKRYEKRPKPLRFVAQDIGPWIAAQPKPKARTIIGALPPPPNMDYSAYEDGAA
jgi:DNA-binding MarR family transcriptional regulator